MAVVLLWLAVGAGRAAESTNTFVVASYNLENWLAMDREGVPNQPKPDWSKAAVARALDTVRPDVLGVQELGTRDDLTDLQHWLKDKGLEYSYREWIQGLDQVRHVALLSRFPIIARDSRTDYAYHAGTNTFRVGRGFIDVEIQPNPQYRFRLVVAHLKSRRQVPEGDEEVMRLEEARLLRGHLSKAWKEAPDENLMVIGDFNDVPDSKGVQTIIGAPPMQFVDLKPVDSRGFTGTHFWRWRQQFSRIDYLLLNPAMANEYVPGSARMYDHAGWEKASDHHVIYARFRDHDLPVGTTTPAPGSAAAPATSSNAPANATPATGEVAPPATATLSARTIYILVGVFAVADVVLLVWIFRRRRKRS